MAGKGSSPRPIPDKEQFASNWDMVFGNQQEHKKCGRCGQYFVSETAQKAHSHACPQAQPQ